METSIHQKQPVSESLRDRFRLIRENRKLIAQFILAFLFIAIGTWFFKHEQSELREVKNVLFRSKGLLVVTGILITVVYIILQGSIYKLAFAALNSRVSLVSTVLLFLKRNFISIFMPAGGVTSLAFFTAPIENQGITKTKIHFASSIYAFIGILSVVILAVPISIYALIHGMSGAGELVGLAAMMAVIILLYLAYRSIFKRGFLYRLFIRFIPSMEVFFDDLINHSISTRYIILTILVSILVDITGIVSLYVAMLALGVNPSLLYAMLGYLTMVLSLFISPFMRGLGLVELSLSFVLTRFGYTKVEAVAVTFLFRFFEFWLPLLFGALSFLLKINKLLMRIIPAVVIFVLGIINIISAITPAIHERVQRLEDFIPVDAIAASNLLILVAGVFMLLSAIFLLKGLRNAWWIALFLSIFSCIGHLTKAIDYEEASIALVVIVILLFSRKEYYIRGNPRMHAVGIRTALWTIGAILVYGTVGFYFLDQKHFGIDFRFWQSVRCTFENFFLLGSPDLVAKSRFAKDFLISINISGILSLSFLAFTILRPYIFRQKADAEILETVRNLVSRYGKSSLDYFKTYPDKQIFIPEGVEGFISYRTAGNFAVVLEDPVAAGPEEMKKCIGRFDRFCYENSLKSIYYRVPEESLPLYAELRKKSLFLGQEGIVNLDTFSLEGGKNKALRNALNKVAERGYKSSIHLPPVKDGIMQRLKAVSDEWLSSGQRKEIIFSQGRFTWNEIKLQTIITVENAEEKVVAFINIIPDFTPDEGTYDLIRKTDDAPNGVLDFILVELFKYLKFQGYTHVNLGFAPLSGLNDPHTFTERTMEFAYQKIKSFSHYRGLRNFKEKFFPEWYNRYLVYSNDFDLLQVPVVLTKVIKPGHE